MGCDVMCVLGLMNCVGDVCVMCEDCVNWDEVGGVLK